MPRAATLAFAAFFACSALPGCSAARKLEARESRDKAALGEASGEYWKGVRWSDVALQSKYLPRAEEQLAVAKIAATPVMRISDVRLLQVAVDPELLSPPYKGEITATRREGVVLVHVEWYQVAGTRVVTESVEQRWRMDASGWTIDTAKSPIDADRPW